MKKVVHIFRNPLDNVVAVSGRGHPSRFFLQKNALLTMKIQRFHLERKRFASKKDNEWLNEYPNTKAGFRVSQYSHCLYLCHAHPTHFLSIVTITEMVQEP